MGSTKASRPGVLLYMAAAIAAICIFRHSSRRSLHESSGLPTAIERIPLISLPSIEALYQKHRVSDAYLNKWADIDTALQRLTSAGFDARGRDAPRVFTLLDFQEWVATHNLHPQKMLVTDANDPELYFINATRTVEYRYAGSNEANDKGCGIRDLHCLGHEDSFTEKDFDMVIISQTLEHLYNPLLAIKNVFDITKKEGYVFTSAPTLNIPHMTPVHFFHYTPMGFVVLFAQAGFEIVEMGQFGNRHYEQMLLNQHHWPDVYQIKNMANSTVINERNNPDQVWVLARKP